MRFKEFYESAPMGDDYWAKRMQQFQAAADGQKGAIEEEPPTQTNYKSGQIRRPPMPPQGIGTTRALTQQEVLRLGLHPHHVNVWQGSTADAPPVYPYVYVKRLNKYMTNPAYKG